MRKFVIAFGRRGATRLLTAVVVSVVTMVFLEVVALAAEVPELKEIVVTATKVQEKKENLPVSASVLTESDVRNIRSTFADEALKYLPGAYLKRAKFTATTSNVTLRGFPAENRTLVLLDGQPLNDAYGGSLEWSAISLERAEKIEVVKGPFSSLYGGYAMGGVINILTRTPGERQVSIRTAYGSHNTFCQDLSYSEKIGGLSFNLYGGKKWCDGRRTAYIIKSAKEGSGEVKVTGYKETKDKYGRPCYLIGDGGKNYWDQAQYGAKFSLSLREGSELSLRMAHNWRKYGYRDPRSYLRDENGNPVDEGKADIGGRYIKIKPYNFFKSYGIVRNDCYSLRYSTSLGEDVKLEGRASINDNLSWWVQAQNGATQQGGPGKIDWTEPNRTVEGELRLSIPFNLLGKGSILTTGLNYRSDRAASKRWELADWLDEESKKTREPYSRIGGKVQASAIYAQLRVKPIERLRLFAGGRFDWWRNYDASLSDEGNLTRYEASNSSHFSPTVGILYKPGFDLGLWRLERIRASWGTAFRPPTIYELYKTWSFWGRVYEANPELTPETSTSWEAGFDQTLLGTRVSFTHYQSRLENLIYYKLITEKHKQRQNAGKGTIEGIEIEVARSITPWLHLSGNLTYQHTEITENPGDPESVGKQFQLVPKGMHNIMLLFHKAGWSASLAWRYASKVYGSSDNSDTQEGVYGSYDPVNTLNAKIRYAVTEHLELSLAVDNLLDREYYEYYRAPGRSFFVQGEYKQ
ncbi:MAG TPA: TonB-dependent receptor [Candidatus Latescibacteria bacterium]|nr:TonB-dependent receptor [Candidatus Latescibacterota bacterium]